MADRTRKPIDQIKVGDKVLATNTTTGKTQPRTVLTTLTSADTKKLTQITVDTDGTRGTTIGTITATDNHPFWIPTQQQWLNADQLKPGMWLRTSAGTHVQITAIKAVTQYQRVHNLTVDTDHTYYVVAGSTPVLVHNCDLGTIHSGKAAANNRAAMNVHGKDGFSGVFDPKSGVVHMRISGGPNALVDRLGGHGTINRAVFGESPDAVGFVAVLGDEGSVLMRWNSRSVNEVNFGDRAAPMEHRQSIMDEIARITGLGVTG